MGYGFPGEPGPFVVTVNHGLYFFRQAPGGLGRRKARQVRFFVFGVFEGCRIDDLVYFFPFRGQVGLVKTGL